ncbi:L,D-transpeptidase [Candidatus Woesearchaeota archaeon]|nr:L,D-transpeptidase [Candidatus Woesearchaeota archaeon]
MRKLWLAGLLVCMPLQAATIDEIADAYKSSGAIEKLLYVDGSEQRMYLYDGERVQREYFISTSKYGFGEEEGKGHTPTGLHGISSFHGKDVPFGAILDAREWNGEIAKIYTDETDIEEDVVTTRVIRLDGLEDHNWNTYDRFIYLHGTPEEGLLGTPASHGCIRMRNEDVMELYELISKETLVYISED